MEIKKFNFTKIIVHGGTFHADDIMCCALARFINPSIKIERVFKVTDEMSNDTSTIICDIGEGAFDHHQDAKIRENGNKYAACGLFFEAYGREIFTREESYNAFLENYIIPIELQDNGVERNPLSIAIGNFNPTWDANEIETESQFNIAVEFCMQVISNSIRNMNSAKKAESIKETALDKMNNGLIILDQYIPTTHFIGTGAKLIVAPSNRGGFNILTVPNEIGTFKNVLDLPEEWLKEKPVGCTFVHQARFIAAFDNLENAVKSAKEILNITYDPCNGCDYSCYHDGYCHYQINENGELESGANIGNV